MVVAIKLSAVAMMLSVGIVSALPATRHGRGMVGPPCPAGQEGVPARTHQTLHPRAAMCLRGGKPPLALPCTPAGCVELLQRSGVAVAGKEVVVLGRSNIVGMPVAHLLQSMDATVTVCHSRTQDLPSHVRRADILVAAVGSAECIKGEWLKPGCVVIDVGVNSKPSETDKRGYVLVGDVDFESAKQVAGMITPVPGGVGPMTIAMLMKNTLNLARHSLNLPREPLRKTKTAYPGTKP